MKVKNYGYMGDGRTERDFLAGVENRINWVVLQEDGDWEKYLPNVS